MLRGAAPLGAVVFLSLLLTTGNPAISGDSKFMCGAAESLLAHGLLRPQA